MTKAKIPESVKVLLLQARESSDPMRQQERRCFARKAGLSPERFTPFDLLAGPPTLAEIKRYDALMVGGSGDYYVSKGNLPGFEELLAVLREVAAAGHPTFASCFGFQLMVEALGGEIVHDVDNIEVGTYEITLTDAGAGDPLFGYLPERFPAQVGRKDRAARLPPNTVHLATSERCPFHALRLPGQPIWATQFHPELDREENRARYINYLEGYGSILNPVEQEQVMERFQESPQAEELIPRFLNLLFG